MRDVNLILADILANNYLEDRMEYTVDDLATSYSINMTQAAELYEMIHRVAKTGVNDFDAFEEEEAAKRASSFNREEFLKKSKSEQARHDAGIGVEETTDDDEDEDNEEDC